MFFKNRRNAAIEMHPCKITWKIQNQVKKSRPSLNILLVCKLLTFVILKYIPNRVFTYVSYGEAEFM